MFKHTLSKVVCPACLAKLELCAGAVEQGADVAFGSAACVSCKKKYPILAGVLILVEDVGGYLESHVKGISRFVDDAKIPKNYRTQYLEAKSLLEDQHIDEDLEAERVTALYVMTHYMRASEVHTDDPVLKKLILEHWDVGPFVKIKKIVENHKGFASGVKRGLVELGCGVGGLCATLQGSIDSYLGLDQSFASIVLARRLALGVGPKIEIQIPDDLLFGTVSRHVPLNSLVGQTKFEADFMVCDLTQPPLVEQAWQWSAALNVIDMLPEPKALPVLQFSLLQKNGIALQSSPYIWHPQVSASLRKKNKTLKASDSAELVEGLYRATGFKIEQSLKHVLWLFFKNNRQLEVYSVHLFSAVKCTE